MKKDYIPKALRHLLKLTLLVAVLFGIMYFTNTLAIAPSELLGTRGAILVVALLVISATYPIYGFTTYTLLGSIATQRREIEDAMEMCGYALKEVKDGELHFRATSLLKRLRYIGGDDLLVVRQLCEQNIEISGNRHEAEKARFRMAALLRN